MHSQFFRWECSWHYYCHCVLFFPDSSEVFFSMALICKFFCSQASKLRLNLMHLSVCVWVFKRETQSWAEWGMSAASSNINNRLLFPKDAFSSHTEINKACRRCCKQQCWEAWLAFCNLQLLLRLSGCSHTHSCPHAGSLWASVCFWCLPKLKACICCQCARPDPDEFIYYVYICKHIGVLGALWIFFLFVYQYIGYVCTSTWMYVCICVIEEIMVAL